jgi:MoaA/NifB/PqqE/SkfB family radical SAM enzyme
MQPKSKVDIDNNSLNIIMNTAKNIAIPRRERRKDPGYATKMPEVVGIKLTNRCNLRCAHCYEWNENGYHHFMDEAEQSKDLDFSLLSRVINETKEEQSRLYLWGGEPLCYAWFSEMADQLEKENREITICTNALLVEDKIDSILKLSDNLEILIPIEGFEKEHDAIRGKGNFNKVMSVVDFLGDLRRRGVFKGKISVHTVINDAMIGKLYDLVEFFEKKDIDFVMLCYPWYISDKTSKEMDSYFAKHFNWLDNHDPNKSWNAFKYRINSEYIP